VFAANLTASPVQLSADSDFHFEILRDLSSGPYGGSDMGEVLEAAGTVVPGDFESFYNAFNNMANRVYQSALAINASRFPVSARDTFFRASTYYRSADFYLHGNPSDPRINSLWVQQATAFNKALALLPVPGKRVNLTAEGFTVPAIYYPASKESKPRRPTLIIGGGYDGGQEELFHQAARAAVERGYNAITYEGPGQASVVREQGLGFIVEWEKVVTPIVDYLRTLPEVDTASIGLVGFSFGGFLAPRAAVYEHRVAAVITLDGLYTFGSLFLEKFPAALTALFKSGNQTAFDSAVFAAISSPNAVTELKWTIEQGLWAFNTRSPFNWMSQIQNYTLEGLVDKISCPVFCADAQDDMFFQGEGKVLAEKLGNRSTYYQFLTADGSGEHAGVGSFVKQSQVAMDWFQEILDARH
jgi:dienelactone hydrolase